MSKRKALEKLTCQNPKISHDDLSQQMAMYTAVQTAQAKKRREEAAAREALAPRASAYEDAQAVASSISAPKDTSRMSSDRLKRERARIQAELEGGKAEDYIQPESGWQRALNAAGKAAGGSLFAPSEQRGDIIASDRLGQFIQNAGTAASSLMGGLKGIEHGIASGFGDILRGDTGGENNIAHLFNKAASASEATAALYNDRASDITSRANKALGLDRDRLTDRQRELLDQYYETDNAVKQAAATERETERENKAAAYEGAVRNNDFAELSRRGMAREQAEYDSSVGDMLGVGGGWGGNIAQAFSAAMFDKKVNPALYAAQHRDELIPRDANGEIDAENFSEHFGNAQRAGVRDAEYLYMTDDEVAVYTYWFEKEGRKKADEYFKSIHHRLEERRAEAQYAGEAAWAEQNPTLASAASVVTGLGNVGAAANTAISAIGDPDAPADPNNVLGRAARLTNAFREGAQRGINSERNPVYKYLVDNGVSPMTVEQLNNFMYGTGMSMADCASQAVLFGPDAALYVMSLEAAGQNAQQSAELGIAAGDAAEMMAVAGLAEYVTEKLPLENFFRLTQGGGRFLSRETLKAVMKQAGIEGTEELISSYMDTLGDIAINGDMSQYEMYIQQCMSGGMTREQAEYAANYEFFFLQPMQDAAGGMLSGVGFGVGGSAIGDVRTRAYGSNLDATQVAQAARTTGDAQLGALADTMQQSIDNGGRVSAIDRGTLAIRTQQYIQSLPEQQQIGVGLRYRQAMGEKLNLAEQAALDLSEGKNVEQSDLLKIRNDKALADQFAQLTGKIIRDMDASTMTAVVKVMADNGDAQAVEQGAQMQMQAAQEEAQQAAQEQVQAQYNNVPAVMDNGQGQQSRTEDTASADDEERTRKINRYRTNIKRYKVQLDNLRRYDRQQLLKLADQYDIKDIEYDGYHMTNERMADIIEAYINRLLRSNEKSLRELTQEQEQGVQPETALPVVSAEEMSRAEQARGIISSITATIDSDRGKYGAITKYAGETGISVEQLVSDVYNGRRTVRGNAGTQLSQLISDAQNDRLSRQGGEVVRFFALRQTDGMSWDEQMERLFGKGNTLPNNATLNLGESGSLYADFGMDDLPIAMERGVVTKAMREKRGSRSAHGLTEADIRALPYEIQHPAAIIDETDRNSVIVVTGRTDKSGFPIVAVIAKNVEIDYRPAHKITSVYGRSSLLHDIESGKSIKIYDAATFQEHKKRLQELTSVNPFIMTGDTGSSEANNSIPENTDDVKPKFKATRTSDAAYMQAAQAGDIETCRRMVDEAAREAGYTIKAYHGTPDGRHTVFDDWQFFSADERYANAYQSPTASFRQSKSVTSDTTHAKTYEVYIKPGKVFDSAGKDRQIFEAALRYNADKMSQQFGRPVDADQEVQFNEGKAPNSLISDSIVEYLEDNGYDFDTIIVDEGQHLNKRRPKARFSFLVRHSEQVKSADPITYDDNGDIIPLSERFNSEKGDIRFKAEKKKTSPTAAAPKGKTAATKKTGSKQTTAKKAETEAAAAETQAAPEAPKGLELPKRYPTITLRNGSKKATARTMRSALGSTRVVDDYISYMAREGDKQFQRYNRIARELKKIGDVYGIKVYITDGVTTRSGNKHTYEAAYVTLKNGDRVVYVNAHALDDRSTAIRLIGHEIAHDLVRADGTILEAFDYLTSEYFRSSGRYHELSNRLNEIMETRVYDESDPYAVFEEYFADVAGEMFDDEDFLNYAAEENPTLLRRIIRAIGNALRRIGAALRGEQPVESWRTKAAEQGPEYYEYYSNVRAMMLKALENRRPSAKKEGEKRKSNLPHSVQRTASEARRHAASLEGRYVQHTTKKAEPATWDTPNTEIARGAKENAAEEALISRRPYENMAYGIRTVKMQGKSLDIFAVNPESQFRGMRNIADHMDNIKAFRQLAGAFGYKIGFFTGRATQYDAKANRERQEDLPLSFVSDKGTIWINLDSQQTYSEAVGAFFWQHLQTTARDTAKSLLYHLRRIKALSPELLFTATSGRISKENRETDTTLGQGFVNAQLTTLRNTKTPRQLTYTQTTGKGKNQKTKVISGTAAALLMNPQQVLESLSTNRSLAAELNRRNPSLIRKILDCIVDALAITEKAKQRRAYKILERAQARLLLAFSEQSARAAEKGGGEKVVTPAARSLPEGVRLKAERSREERGIEEVRRARRSVTQKLHTDSYNSMRHIGLHYPYSPTEILRALDNIKENSYAFGGSRYSDHDVWQHLSALAYHYNIDDAGLSKDEVEQEIRKEAQHQERLSDDQRIWRQMLIKSSRDMREALWELGWGDGRPRNVDDILRTLEHVSINGYFGNGTISYDDTWRYIYALADYFDLNNSNDYYELEQQIRDNAIRLGANPNTTSNSEPDSRPAAGIRSDRTDTDAEVRAQADEYDDTERELRFEIAERGNLAHEADIRNQDILDDLDNHRYARGQLNALAEKYGVEHGDNWTSDGLAENIADHIRLENLIHDIRRGSYDTDILAPYPRTTRKKFYDVAMIALNAIFDDGYYSDRPLLTTNMGVIYYSPSDLDKVYNDDYVSDWDFEHEVAEILEEHNRLSTGLNAYDAIIGILDPLERKLFRNPTRRYNQATKNKKWNNFIWWKKASGNGFYGLNENDLRELIDIRDEAQRDNDSDTLDAMDEYLEEINYHRGVDDLESYLDELSEDDDSEPRSRPVVRFKATRLTDAEVRAQADRYVDQYDEIPEGEQLTDEDGEPVTRENQHVPRRVTPDTKVRTFNRTVMEAGTTPDEYVGNIMRNIVNGNSSYTPLSNKAAIGEARRELDEQGYDGAMRKWQGVVYSTRHASKSDIALGELLLIETARRGDAETFERLVSELAAEGTRAGQTVQAMSMLKRLSPEGKLMSVHRQVHRLNEDLGRRGKQTIQIDKDLERRYMEVSRQLNEAREELARLRQQLQQGQRKTTDGRFTEDAIDEQENRIRDIENDVDSHLNDIINNAAEQIPHSVGDMFTAWRYLAMLGNTRTHIRNIVGNLFFAPAVAAKDIIGGLIEDTFADKLQHRTKTVLRRTTQAQRDFARQDAEEMKDMLQGSGKYNPADGTIADQQKPFTEHTILGRGLNIASKAVGDALETEDWWFLRPHYIFALQNYMAANDIKPADMTGERLQRAREYATREAQKATYRDANAFADFVADASRRAKGKFWHTLIEGVLPFKKTPANIVKRGIEYSPANFMWQLTRGIYNLRKGKITGAEFIDNLSSGMTGTAIAGLGMLMASLGMARGKKHDDDDQYYFEKLQGLQDYSLIFGDVSYTVDWMAPSSLPFFVGVELYRTIHKDYTDAKFADILTSLEGITEPVFNLSMLDGVSDVLRSFKTEGAISQMALNSLDSFLGQMFPTLGGQINRIIDPTKRNAYYIDKNSEWPQFVQKVAHTSMQKVPGMSKLLPEKVDAWGRIQNDDSLISRIMQNLISPGYWQKRNTTEVDVILQELYDATGNARVFPRTANTYISGYNLTADEYVVYAQTKGKTSYNLINAMRKSPEWRRASSGEKIEWIVDAYDYADAIAKAKIVNSGYKIDQKGEVKWYAKAKSSGNVVRYIITGEKRRQNKKK